MKNLDFNTTASFDVDAQQCFTPLCPNELPVPQGDEIVHALNDQATFARWRIGSKDAHPPNPLWQATDDHPPLSPLLKENADLYWPLHGVVGSRGFELLPGLPHPAEYDFFVWKGIERDMHPYGACFHDLKEKQSTGVIEFMHTKGIKTVIVGGLATEYCVMQTVLQLLQHNIKVILNLSACRGLSLSDVKSAVTTMTEAGAMCVDDVKIDSRVTHV